jgi:hypothetical protein
MHSGTICRQQLDIKNCFFVLYVDLKPSDDFFLEKKKNWSLNGEHLSMEKFENFCLQKWIFAVFAFFSTVFWRISAFSA